MIRVTVSPAAPGDWDGFVDAQAASSVYHRSALVQVGARAFGLRTLFLSARDASGALAAALPLVEQKSPLFGHFFTSVPFFNYGGVVGVDEVASARLVDEAGRLSLAAGARHLELRHVNPLPGAALPQRLDKVSMVRELPPDMAQLLTQMGSKLRSQVKRADRENPVLRTGGVELLDDFHAVFAPVMRDLGTPVYPKKFFRHVLEALGERGRVLIVYMGGVPVAASVLVRWRDEMEVPWAATLPRAKSLSVNMYLYREMLRISIESGCSRFDFGRSTVDSGTYRFKAQWGAEPRQLHWQYCLPAGAPVPVLNSSNPKYALVSALWRRLPLGVANAVGPLIIRNLP
jgi:serine/alanine adding enzyme